MTFKEKVQTVLITGLIALGMAGALLGFSRFVLYLNLGR